MFVRHVFYFKVLVFVSFLCKKKNPEMQSNEEKNARTQATHTI